MSADAWAAAAAALAAAVCCAAWLDAALPAAAGRYARPGTGSLTAHPDALFLALWAGATAVTQVLDVAALARRDPAWPGPWGWLVSAIAGAAGAVVARTWPGRLGAPRTSRWGDIDSFLDGLLVAVAGFGVAAGLTGFGAEPAGRLRPLVSTALALAVLTSYPMLLARRDYPVRLPSPSLLVTLSGALLGVAASGALGALGRPAPAAIVLTAACAALAAVALSRTPQGAVGGVPADLPEVRRAAAAVPVGLAIVAALVLAARREVTLLAALTLALALRYGVTALAGTTTALAARSVQRRLEAVLAGTSELLLDVDPGGIVTAAHATADLGVTPLAGREPEALVGLPLAAVVPREVRDPVEALLADVLNGRRAEGRVELPGPSGEGALLRVRGVPGGALVTVAVAAGDAENAELRARLAEVGRHDQLTGLASRARLVEQLELWLAARRLVTLVCVDLDSFRQLNDRFGRAAGDAVLVEVGERLRVAGLEAPGASLVARPGGDTLALAVAADPGTASPDPAGEGLGGGATLAARVLAALRPAVTVGEVSVRVEGSAGWVLARPDDRDGEQVLQRCEVAVAAAKRAGRGRAVAWQPTLGERARIEADVAIGLRQALDTGRLDLAYQPIVRLSDGVVVGVEALVRPPSAGSAPLADLVSPAELVEVAEGTGEIDELGRWVLAEATHQAALWQAMGHAVRVNVNMSVRQLSHPLFVEAVRSALAAAQLAPDRLVIEITEGQLVGEGDVADAAMRHLRGDGVFFAIDDFGSGYSSLSYLRRMPVRSVKIDKSLLAGVGSDPRATTLARAVIGAARGLGLQVVCEGIEDLATARLLRDLGAWAGQGFALHGAVSATELLDILDAPPVNLAAHLPRPRRSSRMPRRLGPPV